MIKRILVAADGSPLAGKAVKLAADMAKQMKAGVTVIGVVDLTSLILPGGITPAVRSAQAAMATQDLVNQAVTEQVHRAVQVCVRSGIKARSAVRSGKPAEEIVKEAKRSKADLIIVGSHGRSAIKAAVLGSVAYGVIHRSTAIPVLTVRG
jgi:nucleotide-binding universal stress UspA family protein